MEHSPSWEASHSATQISGTWRFITVFTSAHHWSLSWARWIQSTTSHAISVRSIQIPSSHLCPDLLSGFFPLGFLTKILGASHLPCPMHATHPALNIPLDLINLIIFSDVYKLWSSSSCCCLQPPATFPSPPTRSKYSPQHLVF